jgi:hypothetical protein
MNLAITIAAKEYFKSFLKFDGSLLDKRNETNVTIRCKTFFMER